jgi:uncharacterized protein
MSSEITGTQHPSTNEKNPQVNEHHSHATAAGPKIEHELQPDLPPSGSATEGKTKRPRGFAAMDRKLVSEIARKGGKAAHSAGTAHEFTSEEARVAGQKGGRATHAKRRKTDRPEAPEASETPPKDENGS